MLWRGRAITWRCAKKVQAQALEARRAVCLFGFFVLIGVNASLIALAPFLVAVAIALTLNTALRILVTRLVRLFLDFGRVATLKFAEGVCVGCSRYGDSGKEQEW